MDGWDGLDGWLSLYDGLLRAPTVLISIKQYQLSLVALIALMALIAR